MNRPKSHSLCTPVVTKPQFPSFQSRLTLPVLLASALTLACPPAQAKVQIASGGIARCVIVTQPGATPAERYAAEELAATLKQITGATFVTRELADNAPESAIVVGAGPLAAKLFPEVDLATFGGEEYVIRTQGGRLLLAGGRPRGTLYAVYRFLQDQLGVRYYAPWFTHYPDRAALTLGTLNVRGKPAFEYRDPFWFPAFDGDWAARNGSTSATARLKEKHGGQMTYKGFVHTFYPLVPPGPLFQNPSRMVLAGQGQARGGKARNFARRTRNCGNFIVERSKPGCANRRARTSFPFRKTTMPARVNARAAPRWTNAKARHAGSLLELVNYVAEKIEPEFPNVLVDTLAYQYTRKAPKTLRPRRNVIIRLCSIECNFAKPLTDPSNELFARDIRDWHRLTDRLYVWDYTTDFSHYLLPFPNYYVLGPNVRFFHRNGVVGLFEQGAYQSFSNEMSEMRAWVLAQLLWNPYQDDRKLVREFVEAYYGKPSAPFILKHLDLISKAAQPYYVGIGHPDASPYLRFPTLVKSERLWQQAEDAARGNPDHLWRVRQARLPISYLWLSQWVGLQRECRELGEPWPINPSRKAYAARMAGDGERTRPAGWSPMNIMRESGQKPADFAAASRQRSG